MTDTAVAAPTVFHRDLLRPHKAIARADGMYLYDADGKRYLDGVGGVAVNIIGHAVPEITAEIDQRREQLSFSYAAVFSNPWQEQLAESILEMSPFDRGSVFFASGGSEANEIAIKFARQYHLERGNARKWKVISRWQAYHGNTFATLGISGRPSWRSGFDPYFAPNPRVSAPYGYRAPVGLSDEALLDYWIEEFERVVFHEGAETIAAFIAEPVLGSSLVGVVPPAGYYERIRAICDRHDILFIADEVLAGYGRTGKNFSIDHWNAMPDIITAGKGIGSGYVPIAAVVLSERVADAFASGSGSHTQGYTFSGMPMACFIGTKVHAYLTEHGLVERSARMGEYLHARLREMQGRVEAVGEVRGIGLLGGVELVADRATRAPFSASERVARRVVDACEQRGLALLPGSPDADFGNGGDLIQISPAYVIDEAQIDELVGTLEEAIVEVAAAR
ncbi:aspartate aminotransferase family protein [Ruicaihuangia caeni]|uniref:Aspartate aminotransferase family protein n=1 Tax=Ruicaihuangia caeni TaxID=3042517 RepID=A0AAW6T877_9MICO|nr:aspartate aminotransferase family protein [Klugiella sp. YN-L-19]MDI2099429.1 aspartate aminotransferase family protein [Klugiella sp. YN-L-19]